MKQLRLLMALCDCGVDAIYHDGQYLYFLPRAGEAPPVVPEDLMSEVRAHIDWFIARVKRLPTSSRYEVLT